MIYLSRRSLLAGASIIAIMGPSLASAAANRATRVQPVPAGTVRLTESIFADAVAANRRYLLSLDPDRLLHNFYVSAGLTAPKPVYGGWESTGIAGHSVGHWLSAMAITVAQTGDTAARGQLDHALAAMARIQAAHGDGYVGGTTVERDGKQIDGKIIFEEVRRGDIRTQGFDLNGGWVPLYTWHKVQAGLIDAHQLAGNPRALPILTGMAGYLAGVLEPLTDAQMQQVLRAEHGGLNEAYADTYAITGDPRWLRMAEKIRHKAVLDPLTARQDKLAGLHANTQIPKLIGLARLHELTDNPAHATAARFFHETVTGHHSYVIGGNSEREHFGEPNRIAGAITEATCEACNSYNMLKLTRHLYGWQPRAGWFDYYERVQLNHIMAHQRPSDGAFVYFMPLSAGARRSYSTAEESFWCCVGSGMESHAKHADSIYWHDAETLYVNLFIPSRLNWRAAGWGVDMATKFPMDGNVAMTVTRAPRDERTIAIRLPRWAKDPVVTLDGKPAAYETRDGYALIRRRWRGGERIALSLPMALSVEPTPDDPATVAFVSGPLVLAADLGPADRPFAGAEPVLVVDGAATAALRPAGSPHRYSAKTALGDEMTLSPFFPQYDRRTAVYFPAFTTDHWATTRTSFVATQQARRALAERTIDTAVLGEMQPERDHAFAASRSETVQLHGRGARKLRAGEHLTLRMARRPGTAVLRLTLWAGDVDRIFTISVDGREIATERRSGPGKDAFVTVDHPVPAGAGAYAVIRIDARQGDADIYEVTMLAPEVAITT